MNQIIIHKKRAIIEIKGQDRKKFLQGLITNDVQKLGEDNILYSAMLNAQGRFLYDFFIFAKEESLFLDCFAPRRDEIIKKLTFYKLRAKVEISKNDALQAVQTLDGDASFKKYVDPRHHNLGFRAYLDEQALQMADILPEAQYDFLRISNKIAEGEEDLTYEKSFILEFGFDDLQAIDYQKGCYVGQELTARTHYRGQIRKKLVYIILDEEQKLQKGQKFSCEGKNLGIVLSSVFYEGKFHILALVRLDDVDGEVEFEPNNIEFEQI